MAHTNERSAAKEIAPKSPHDHVAITIKEDDPQGSTSQPTTDHHQPCIETLLGVTKTMHDYSTDHDETRHMIGRVPKILGENEVNRDCFTPLLIALGPYHCDKEANTCKRGKEFKIPLMKRLFDYDNPSIMAHFNGVQKVVQKARDCYADQGSTANVPDDLEFAVMMFLDGSAVLQFMSCVGTGDWRGLNIKYYERQLFTHDLFLLENQVPLLVLEQLMHRDKIQEIFKIFMTDLSPVHEVKAPWPLRILDFLDNFCRQKNTKQTGLPQDKDLAAHSPAGAAAGQPPPLHLLEMLWSHYVRQVRCPRSTSTPNGKKAWYTFRAVKELKASGILFSHSKPSNFTDVRYRPLPITHISYLCLPPIIVDEHTKALLLNLASHEMSSLRSSYPVSSYICFMDSLIDNTEDVAELRRSGIIHNGLGSDLEVATLFNDVSKNLVPERGAFQHVMSNIENHYRSRIKIRITKWLYANFRLMAFIPAVIALGSTLLQTFRAESGKKGPIF